MKKITKLIRNIVFTIISIFFILIVLLGLLMSRNSVYYVEAYKTDIEISQNNQENLRNHFTSVNLDKIELRIEWYTYDNKKINQAPYKLFIIAVPKNNDVRSIVIEDIKIKSSLDNQYLFLESNNFPIELAFDRQSETANRKFEPAFYFNFIQKEIIEIQISVFIDSGNVSVRKVIKQKWKPIRIKHRAPVV